MASISHLVTGAPARSSGTTPPPSFAARPGAQLDEEPLVNPPSKTVVLHDVDSRIPNLALLKLATFHRQQGWRVLLSRDRSSGRRAAMIDADVHLASVVFRTPSSASAVEKLKAVYGDRIEFGGSGVDLGKRLSAEVEACFPDYRLYEHTLYALGFLTRGCNKKCAFCVVPEKEGRLKGLAASFDDFVPKGQQNVLLLDDNLLAYREVESLLDEMIARRYAINFSQTLDIAYLNEAKFNLLRQIDSRNSKFSKRMIYFSLNHARDIRQFERRAEMLKGFGEHGVCVVMLYGFDTRLSEDNERFRFIRRQRYLPFFQEYWPIEGVPSRLTEDYFDIDLNAVIRLTFHSNGYNWEKYLLWLNSLYFQRYGRFYTPLVEILYRYNHKHRLEWFRMNPGLLSNELYQDQRDSLADFHHRLRQDNGLPAPRGLLKWIELAAAGTA